MQLAHARLLEELVTHPRQLETEAAQHIEIERPKHELLGTKEALEYAKAKPEREVRLG